MTVNAVTYEVEGQTLARVFARPIFWGGLSAPPPSYAFVCPVCGQVWARITSRRQNYIAVTRPCRHHTRDSFEVPGSMWMPHLQGVIETFPTEVLQWELLRHIDWHEKKAQR